MPDVNPIPRVDDRFQCGQHVQRPHDSKRGTKLSLDLIACSSVQYHSSHSKTTVESEFQLHHGQEHTNHAHFGQVQSDSQHNRCQELCQLHIYRPKPDDTRSTSAQHQPTQQERQGEGGVQLCARSRKLSPPRLRCLHQTIALTEAILPCLVKTRCTAARPSGSGSAQGAYHIIS